jgi:hypothetical protein
MELMQISRKNWFRWLKKADLIILDKNLFEIPVIESQEIKSNDDFI